MRKEPAAKNKLFSFCSRNKKQLGHLQPDPISSISSNLHFPRFSFTKEDSVNHSFLRS